PLRSNGRERLEFRPGSEVQDHRAGKSQGGVGCSSGTDKKSPRDRLDRQSARDVEPSLIDRKAHRESFSESECRHLLSVAQQHLSEQYFGVEVTHTSSTASAVASPPPMH